MARRRSSPTATTRPGTGSVRTKPVPGNHEYHTSGAKGYFGYWGAQAKPNGTSYYSFDLGDWHVVALDFEIGLGSSSSQAKWLKSDLAASRKRCKLAYLHKPRWSSGRHGNSSGLADVYKILYDDRVTLLLSGHDHDYERFAPLAPAGAVDNVRARTWKAPATSCGAASCARRRAPSARRRPGARWSASIS